MGKQSGRTSQARWNAEVRDETPHQSADRQLTELVQEIRVAQAGVQILFAFLLVIPFQQTFLDSSQAQHQIHLAALLTALASVVFLTAPVVFHRMLYRRRMKLWLVEAGNVMAQLGTVFLALSMSLSVLLVVNQSLGPGWASSAAALAVLLFVSIWYALPLTVGHLWGSEESELSEDAPSEE